VLACAADSPTTSKTEEKIGGSDIYVIYIYMYIYIYKYTYEYIYIGRKGLKEAGRIFVLAMYYAWMCENAHINMCI